MRKLILIALKDLRLIFRDRSALVLMLLAPFLLTIGMGAITGRFSGTTSSIGDIPVTIVNQDDGELGKAMVEMFQSDNLSTLLIPTVLDDPQSARDMVDRDASAGAVIIPAGFSASIIPAGTDGALTEAVQVEFYANPSRVTSAGILRTILDSFINQVEIGRVAGAVTVTQLLENGIITPVQAAEVGASIGRKMGEDTTRTSSIKMNNVTAAGEAVQFDILSYMAPGMALMFLMFTVSYGGRSLLLENREGTLQRMLISPTTSLQILGGKVAGIFLTAVAQLTILIGGTSLLFQLSWGDPLGVVVLVLAAAFGATGWGLIIASFLKTPGQVATVGSAVMLIFGILGGSFFDITMLPGWVRVLNKITPNAWGLEGFYTLGLGGKLVDVLLPVAALMIMGTVLFAASSFWITKRGLARQ
jgi:ABC-2 type transport system permease protein